jgi:hypothetical protein
MLAGLDNINWSQLHHAFGSASEVPNWIRALLSEDRQMREKAIYELYENLLHQGSVYEASFYALPFLLELLKFSTSPDKADFAVLLADMGNNSGSDRYELSETEERTANKNLEERNKYAEAIRLSVRKELNTLYPYLFHEVYYVRAVIAHALQAFPEKSQETIPLLEKALETESDETTKHTIEDSIRVLSTSN